MHKGVRLMKDNKENILTCKNIDSVIRKECNQVMHFEDFVKGNPQIKDVTEDPLGAPVGRELL